MKGEIIGISIAILSNGGGNEGVGFSIPISLARWIMGQLLTNGRVSRGPWASSSTPTSEPRDRRCPSGSKSRPKGHGSSRWNLQSPAAQG